MKNLMMIFSALVLTTSCSGVLDDSRHEVFGETTHRFLIGVDTEGLRDFFEGDCRNECQELGVGAGDLPSCVNACVAERAQSFLDIIKDVEEGAGAAPKGY